MKVVMIAFTNIEYTLELAEGLNRKTDILLMIPEKQLMRFREVINKSLNIFPFKQSRLRYPSNIIHAWNMIRKIREFNPDVIHIQRGDPWFNFFIPFLTQYGLVTTIHDVDLHSGDKESKRIPEFTHRIAIRYANQIIVHGQELKIQMIKKTKRFPDDINVLPRGINSIYTRYVAGEVKNESSCILFFGRIWEYKGLRYLIEAEPIISKVIPNIKIIIAGRGENVNNYKRFMMHQDKYVIYNKHISNNMVATLFQMASVVVLPYIDASQSGIVPLAYAFHRPVVVTNVVVFPKSSMME